jgi:hypothetical protein
MVLVYPGLVHEVDGPAGAMVQLTLERMESKPLLGLHWSKGVCMCQGSEGGVFSIGNLSLLLKLFPSHCHNISSSFFILTPCS